MNEIANKEQVDFSYMSFQHDILRDRVKHYNIFKHYNIKYTVTLAMCIFKTRFPISILNDFLHKFVDLENAGDEFKSYILTRIKEIKGNSTEVQEDQLTMQDLIFYGCDEFLARILHSH